MAPSRMFFADVILPLPLSGTFSYVIPSNLELHVKVGVRVVVPFGKHKIYAAIVQEVKASVPPVGQSFKEIMDVLDPAPVLASGQLDFWRWMSDYYLCTPGEVMAAALPVALRLQSETSVCINPTFDGDVTGFNERELGMLELLQQKNSLTLKELARLLQVREAIPLVRNLIARGVVDVHEEVEERVRPKMIEVISLSDRFSDESELGKILDKLERKAPRQCDLVMALLHHRNMAGEVFDGVPRSTLMKIPDASASALSALVKSGVFELSKRVEGRLKAYQGKILPPAALNPHQIQALHETDLALEQGRVTLLHGVTSSGKTELYIHLIARQLEAGKQVLYLVPEIALTTQLILRLQRHFGPSMLVYHSRFNEQERVEVWNSALANSNPASHEGKLIVGARSALFLPLSKLGLVIVDEEHDPSYKQVDPAPRYNARDSAIVIAQRQDAQVLLGSATPSMESYFNALSGKYALVTLDKRHADLSMPTVEVVDMKDARRRKQVSGHFSATLLERLHAVLDEKKQAIVFQNRRGFAPSLECNACAWSPRCVNCDVSLTYHKRDHELRCHYCGYVLHIPTNCAACGDQDLRMRGFGTERIEEDLQLIFPEARIARLDYDTTRGKEGFARIISAFESGEIDFLVGTQMVTKGLDFDRVSLVGILNADALFHFPEFRANERGFQLLAQVSGRAGRKDYGRVVVQAYATDHPVIRFVLKHDFRGFYMHELDERHRFNYPPYCRLIEVRLKHKDERKLERMSLELNRSLRGTFGARVLGPTVPYVNRVRNYYLRNLLLKVEKNLSVAEVKRLLMTALEEYRRVPENRQLLVQVDVDPQ